MSEKTKLTEGLAQITFQKHDILPVKLLPKLIYR